MTNKYKAIEAFSICAGKLYEIAFKEGYEAAQKSFYSGRQPHDVSPENDDSLVAAVLSLEHYG